MTLPFTTIDGRWLLPSHRTIQTPVPHIGTQRSHGSDNSCPLQTEQGLFSWLPPAPLLATPTTSGPAAGVAVPGVPTYPKPRNLQYIFCGFPIFRSCGSSQHRPKDGPNLVQEGANIARRWAKIAPKMASWSKRGQHSRKQVQRRPKMRLLQTLRMGHSHNNNNKKNKKNKQNKTNKTKQTTNNNRRPYKHPAIYGVF